MLRNYLIITFRNLKRNKVFSVINILGLTLGLSIASIILLYLVNELTYDSYHKDSKQIYRLFPVRFPSIVPQPQLGEQRY